MTPAFPLTVRSSTKSPRSAFQASAISLALRGGVLRGGVLLGGVLLGGVLLGGFAGRASAAEWSQWRGPNRDGHTGATLPTSITGESLSEAWSAELGPSYSGPVVDGDRVYTTETVDKEREVVRAFDVATGREVWSASWEGAITVPFFAAANGSWIRSTPVVDEGRIYVAGIRDVLVCLDAATGAELWRCDFVKETGAEVPKFGCCTSPMIHEASVYIQSGNSVAKLDKQTGAIQWRTLREEGGMSGGAFSSPVVATLCGREQLVVQTRAKLAGVDMESGDELWSMDIPAFRGMNILTPTVIGDSIFTSTYGGKSMLLAVSHADEEWSIQERWTHKSQAYMSSPVVVDGHLYCHLRNQRFVCLDASTGEEKWTTRPFGKYWSMIASGGRILALDETGDLMLIAADPSEFKVIEKRSVADDSWAHVCFTGDRIFVRALKSLKAFKIQ